MKNSFILYHEYREQLELLSDGEKGQLLMAIYDYSENGVVPDLSGMVKMAFAFIKQQLDRDMEKYESACQRNSKNGAKGGRPKETEKPKKPSGLSGLSGKPKKPDNDNEDDNDTDNVNENVISPLPPTGERKNKQAKSFDSFWEAYPKKRSKAQAKKAFDKIMPSSDLVTTMLKSIAEQKKSKQWQDEQYIPYPATWLNGNRWEDELEVDNAGNRQANEPDIPNLRQHNHTAAKEGFQSSTGFGRKNSILVRAEDIEDE